MKQKKRFIAVNEGFTCKHCNRRIEPVVGGGYRNHCPFCLWSKHVDSDIPGDRLSDCQGMMKPVSVNRKGTEFVIIHQCVRCQYKKPNKSAKDDDFDTLVKYSVAKVKK